MEPTRIAPIPFGLSLASYIVPTAVSQKFHQLDRGLKQLRLRNGCIQNPTQAMLVIDRPFKPDADKNAISPLSSDGGSGRFLFFADIDLDLELEEAWRGGTDIPLHSVEFRLLRELMLASGRLVSFDELREKVWFGNAIKDRAVQDWITELRHKLRSVGPDIVQSEEGRCGLLSLEQQSVDGDAFPTRLRVGDLTLDRSAMRADRGINRIDLSVAQFALLEFLMLNPKCYFSAEEISNRVFPDEPKDQSAVAGIMSRVRKAIRIAGRIDPICVERGKGYGIFPR